MDLQDLGNDIESPERNFCDEGALERNGSDSAEIREPLLRKRTLNTTSQIAIVGANVCPIESLDYE